MNLIHIGHCLKLSILGVQNGVFISPATHSSHDAGRFDQKWLLFSFEIFTLSSRNFAFLYGGCDKSVFNVNCKIISYFLTAIVGLTSL